MVSRPWLSGLLDVSARKGLAVGDRIDVLWEDGHTSAHFVSTGPGEFADTGFLLTYHGTEIWVNLETVMFRKIPVAKKRPPREATLPRRSRNRTSL